MKKPFLIFFIILSTTILFADKNDNKLYKEKCLSGEFFYCHPFIDQASKNTNIFRIYVNLCKKGNSNACDVCAIVKEELEDFSSSSRFAKQSCELGSGAGCIIYGQYNYGFEGIEKDIIASEKLIRKGAELLNKECENGNKSSCILLLNVFSIKEFAPFFSSTNINTVASKVSDLCISDEFEFNFQACATIAEYSDKNPEKRSGGFNPRVFQERYVVLRENLCKKENDYNKCVSIAKDIKERKYGLDDIDKAEFLFKKACEKKNAEACNYVGIICVEKKDSPKAREFYKKACDLKAGYACSNLGALYESGDGGLMDYEKALYFYNQGGISGSAESLYSAGLLYKKLIEADTNDLGSGVSFYNSTSNADYKVEAFMCFNIASALNHEESRKELDDLKKTMTSGQIMEAQKKSKMWMEKYHNKSK